MEEDPNHLREQAAHGRRLAAAAVDDDVRERILWLAQEYEARARLLEKHCNRAAMLAAAFVNESEKSTSTSQ
jgi:hypothetical protein